MDNVGEPNKTSLQGSILKNRFDELCNGTQFIKSGGPAEYQIAWAIDRAAKEQREKLGVKYNPAHSEATATEGGPIISEKLIKKVRGWLNDEEAIPSAYWNDVKAAMLWNSAQAKPLKDASNTLEAQLTAERTATNTIPPAREESASDGKVDLAQLRAAAAAGNRLMFPLPEAAPAFQAFLDEKNAEKPAAPSQQFDPLEAMVRLDQTTPEAFDERMKDAREFVRAQAATKAGKPTKKEYEILDEALDKIGFKWKNDISPEAAARLVHEYRTDNAWVNEGLKKAVIELLAWEHSDAKPLAAEIISQFEEALAALQKNKPEAQAKPQYPIISAETDAAYAEDTQALYTASAQFPPSDPRGYVVPMNAPDFEQRIAAIRARDAKPQQPIVSAETAAAYAEDTQALYNAADKYALAELVKTAREAAELTADEQAKREKKNPPLKPTGNPGRDQTAEERRQKTLNAPLTIGELAARKGMSDLKLTQGVLERIEEGEAGSLSTTQALALAAALSLDMAGLRELQDAAAQWKSAKKQEENSQPQAAAAKPEAKTQGEKLIALRDSVKPTQDEKNARRESMRKIEKLFPKEAADRIGVQHETYKAWEENRAAIEFSHKDNILNKLLVGSKLNPEQKVAAVKDLMEAASSLSETLKQRHATVLKTRAKSEEGPARG